MLEAIIQKKRQEVAQIKREQPLAAFLNKIEVGTFAFSKALRQAGWALIAECKLASPIKGRLCTAYTVEQLARLYSQNGATALSVLTDAHFCGQLEHLQAVKAVTALPVLRKDFIIDEYQLYQARAAGADAVLLIAASLTDRELTTYLAIAAELGLDSLVEVHTKEELLRVQQTPAAIIGINNRDLKTFVTDIKQTFALLPYCDKSRLLISESGIRSAADVASLKAAGINGVLVGESLVTAPDIAQKTRQLALITRGNK